jgi:hypothetical protein
MCFGNSSPSTPALPPIPAPPPVVDNTIANADSRQARSDIQKRAAVAKGMSSTNNTSPLGITTPATTAATKLYGA